MIPLFDYVSQWQERQSEILATIQRVLNSGQLILGQEVRSFEENFVRLIGCRYGVGVNSGTDALILALRALGIKPGDEVLTVPNSAVPTAAAIRAVGAQPRWVEIEDESLLMNLDALDRAYTPRCKAIIPVHLHGLMVPMTEIKAFAQARGLALIEDCAQSFGAYENGQPAGSFGDASCFSFYPTKNLGAFGDGGLIATQSEELAQTLRAQRMYGFRDGTIAREDGLNSRLDELQAAILQLKLKYFDSDMQKRQSLAARYQRALAKTSLKLPAEPQGRLHSWHLYVVRHPRRDQIRQHLQEQGISTGIHYAVPLHLMPAFQDLGYRAGDFPVAEAAAREMLSLPLYPELKASDQDFVISTLRDFIA